jgi:hypothetical protein
MERLAFEPEEWRCDGIRRTVAGSSGHLTSGRWIGPSSKIGANSAICSTLLGPNKHGTPRDPHLEGSE